MSSNYKPASKTYWPLEEMTDLKIGFWTFNDVYSLSFYIYFTECFHSRGQHLCKFIRTKESVCIRKEFNSHRICLGHQHGRRFIVMAAVTSCENTLYFECVHTSKRTLIQAERSFHFNKWCHDLGLFKGAFVWYFQEQSDQPCPGHFSWKWGSSRHGDWFLHYSNQVQITECRFCS